MSMKKTYISPQVRTFSVSPAQVIATSVTVSSKTIDYDTNPNDIFWSKTFGGTIEDDVDAAQSSQSAYGD